MGFPRRAGISSASDAMGLRAGGANLGALAVAVRTAAARARNSVSTAPTARAEASCFGIVARVASGVPRAESGSKKHALRAAIATAASATEAAPLEEFLGLT